MYPVLGKFRVCEPATVARENAAFLANYVIGRPIDFSDSSGTTFSPTTNEYRYDGTTYNPVYAVDRYGAQEDFYYPSVGVRRKEMVWSSSSFPVSTSASANGGFNLSGTVLGIKKISSSTSVDVMISSSTAIVGEMTTYDSGTGAFTFTYAQLPPAYTELDSSSQPYFDLTTVTDWKAGTYEASDPTNTIINTPYSSPITSLEKYKEISMTVSSFDTIGKVISGTIATGLGGGVTGNIEMIAPNNQTIRVIPMGFFSVANDANSIPTATSLSGLSGKSSYGISSMVYYGIPYQTGYAYSGTSKDYVVRLPVLKVDFTAGGGTLFKMAIAFTKTSSERVNPNGFKLGLSL